jgi:hypothetical protein
MFKKKKFIFCLLLFIFLFHYFFAFGNDIILRSDDVFNPDKQQAPNVQSSQLHVMRKQLAENQSEPDLSNRLMGPILISPDGNYFLCPLLPPISFATGKPIPVKFPHGTKFVHSVIKDPFFSRLHRGIIFSYKEEVLVFFENEHNDDKRSKDKVVVVDLKTGQLIKKIQIPIPEDCEKIDNSCIIGISKNKNDTFVVVQIEYKVKRDRIKPEDMNFFRYEKLLYANIFDNAAFFNFVTRNENCHHYFNYALLSPTKMQFLMEIKSQGHKMRQRYFLTSVNGTIIGKFPAKGLDYAQISKDGEMVVLSHTIDLPYPIPCENYLRFFDMETQKEIFKPFYLGRYLYLTEVVYYCLSDNKKLLAIQNRNAINIYDPETQKHLSRGTNGRIIGFANNDKYIASIQDGKVSFCDIQTGKVLFQLIFYSTKEQHWAIVAADGRYDGTKEILDNIKIKPAGLPVKPENYFSPKDKPNLYVDGLLTTFFNAPMPDHYWFKTQEQIQQIINQQQKQSTLTPISDTKTTIIPLPQIMNSQ